MNTIVAASGISKIYQTGDRPVLVLCSDGYHYICKYKLPGGAANKLVNELIGGRFARLWGIYTPPVSLIANDSIIWENGGVSHDPSAPLLGSRMMENVCDLNEMNCDQVKVTARTLQQILTIALFDLWLSNEDRTCNNYNLLYDLRQDSIVSIDYAGIFNSGIIERPIYQLNEYDSILSSGLYDKLRLLDFQPILDDIKKVFPVLVRRCELNSPSIWGLIPEEWNVRIQSFANKSSELFTIEWMNKTWNNFYSIASR